MTKSIKTNEFIRTNEYIEASNSLKMTISVLKNVREDSYLWKWAIITFHNCIQAFMVLALMGSDNLNVVREKDKNKWLKAYRENKSLPNTSLKSFKDLFDSICGRDMRIFIHSKIFIPESNHIGAIDIINETRNSFIHFQPMGWSLEIDGFPGVFLSLVEILNFIVNDSGNLFDYEENYLLNVRKDIDYLKIELGKLEKYYDDKLKSK